MQSHPGRRLVWNWLNHRIHTYNTRRVTEDYFRALKFYQNVHVMHMHAITLAGLMSAC